MANPITGFDPNNTFYELTPGHCSGTSAVVVLLHGVGLDHRMWDWQMSALTSRSPVLRYDLLGHGRTPSVAASVTLAQFADQLRALLEFLDIESIHLVGFSLGALIAQSFSGRHSETLTSVTFMNGVYRRVDAELAGVRHRLALTREQGASSTVEMAIERWFTAGYRESHPEVMSRVRERLLTNDMKGYVAAYSCFVHGDEEIGDVLKRVTCPALAITGEDDVGSTAEMCKRMADDLRQPTVRVLCGLRHGAPIEGADEMSRALLEFFDSVEHETLPC